MSYVPTQPQADDFMLVDFKHVLDDETPEAVAECEWLLTTATQLVEREAARQGIPEWQLIRRRYDIDSLRVQRAIDILDYGGFIARDPTD